MSAGGIKYARVTNVIDPNHFQVQIGDETHFHELELYAAKLNVHGEELRLSQPELIGITEEWNPGDFLLANSMDWGKWVRVQLKDVFTDTDEVDVLCIDYGTSEVIRADGVLRAEDDTDKFFPQVFQGSLAGVKPIANEWISRATRVFSDIVLMKKHPCEIVGHNTETDITDIDLLIMDDDGEFKSASDIMFEENLAMLVRLDPQLKNKRLKAFDHRKLWSKPDPAAYEEEEEEEEEDIEMDVFRQTLTVPGEENHQSYGRSDDTFGDPYRNSLDTNKLMDLRGQLQELNVGGRKRDGHNASSPNRDKTSSPRGRPLGRGRGIRSEKADVKLPRRSPQKPDKVKDPPPDKVRDPPQNIEPYFASDQNAQYQSRPATKQNRHRMDRNSTRFEAERNFQKPRPRFEQDLPPRFRKARSSQENDGDSSKSDSNERLDMTNRVEKVQKQPEPIKNPPEPISITTPDQQAAVNDYKWHRCRVERRWGKLLTRTDDGKGLMKYIIDEMEQIINSSKDKNVSLAGPCDLHICLELLVSNVLQKKTSADTAICVFEAYRGNKMFPQIIEDILDTYRREVMQLTTNVATQKQREPFCLLIGLLFLASQKWEETSRAPVETLVTKVIEKWCCFNQKNKISPSADQALLYATCLQHLLPLIGGVLQQVYPTKLTTSLNQVKASILDPHISRDTREVLLDVLLAHQGNINIPHPEPVKAVKHEDKSSQVGPRDLCFYCDCGSETECQTCSVQTQTLADPQSRKKNTSIDPYDNVIRILTDIDLSGLIPVFKQNAITDSLLEMDFPDLKELLKEVGLKPGNIWAIKTYRDGKRLQSVSSSERTSSTEVINGVSDSPPNDTTRVVTPHPPDPSPSFTPTDDYFYMNPLAPTQPRNLGLLTPSCFIMPKVSHGGEVNKGRDTNGYSKDPMNVQQLDGTVDVGGRGDSVTNKPSVSSPSRADQDQNWRQRGRSDEVKLERVFHNNSQVTMDESAPYLSDPQRHQYHDSDPGISDEDSRAVPRTKSHGYGPRARKQFCVPGSDEFGD